MRTIFTILIYVAFAVGSTQESVAKNERKNAPKNIRKVENGVKEGGESHFPEKMKINKVGPVEVEPTYYHVYCGSLKKGGYRIIIFDNTPKYLGYYPSEFEPADYGEGEILLDSGESDNDGNTYWHTVRIGPKGPSEKIRIDGVPVTFVKNQQLEEETAATTMDPSSLPIVSKPQSASGEAIEYRDWEITMKGKKIKVNARFEKVEGAKIYIKNSKNGRVAGIPGQAFSQEDREYIKRISTRTKH